jgi:hypothetical protein
LREEKKFEEKREGLTKWKREKKLETRNGKSKYLLALLIKSTAGSGTCRCAV